MLQLSTPLSKREGAVLSGHYKKSGTALIRQRAHAVILFSQGRAAPDIASILLTGEDTVRTWIHAFEEERIASIFPAYSGNDNAAKLTDNQRDEIAQTLKKPPSETGLPTAFWSVARLKQYLKAEYGVVYESERSYHHLFALSGYSFKLPEGFDKRRDEKLVRRRMQELRHEIATLRRKGYTIFAADECSLCFETEYRRAWLKKGEKTLLKVNREKVRQNYFGALNFDTKRHELIRLDWQNTETITGALRELLRRYPKRHLGIVWDNAKWHRSKGLRVLLGKGNEFERLRFLWLPPYAPDENPEEHVWKIGKDAVGNQCAESFNELKKIFESAITRRKFDYTIPGI
ncbi:MAG: IS630 family transposase [Minisyncoccia bacterium]